MLRSAGDNDRRSKCFCPSVVLCVIFTWQMVKNVCDQIHMIRIWVIEGANVRDQIVFCAFHTFLVEVQMNSSYIHATHV